MFSHLNPKERAGYALLIVLFLSFAIYVGSKQIHPSPPLVVQEKSPTRPPTHSKAVQKAIKPEPITIDVAGAVVKEGIYRLPAGSRVVDAVVAAGGAVGADLDQLNLAAKLQDGTEVLVPARGNGNPNLVKQVGPSSEYESTPTRNNRGQKDRGQKTTTPIDLNTASIEELESVPGVGKTTAQRILDYRNQHERFQSIDELISVGGIGAKKLERIRKWLHL